MQLSPLSADLFAANVPPAGGAGLAPAAAPFAQWLSAQTKSLPALADPATPPPFSQFPLNWGFPAAEAAAATKPLAAADTAPLPGAAMAAEILPLAAVAALPKPATAPMAVLAQGGVGPAIDPALPGMQPALAVRDRSGAAIQPPEPLAGRFPREAPLEPAWPAQQKTAAAPLIEPSSPVGSAPDPSLASAEAVLVADPVAASLIEPSSLIPSAPDPSLVPAEAVLVADPVAAPRSAAGRPRREGPLEEVQPQQLQAAAPPDELSSLLPPLSAPFVAPAGVALAPDQVAAPRPAAAAAKPELPAAFAASATQPLRTPPVSAPQGPAAALQPVGLEAKEPNLGSQPTVAPEVQDSRPLVAAAPRPQQAASANPQGQPARAAQNSGLPLDPAPLAEVPAAEVVPASPMLSARPSQAAIPHPPGMAEAPVRAAMPGLEPIETLISPKAELPPVAKSQPSGVQPWQQPLPAAGFEPAPAAALQGSGAAVVAVQPEAAVSAEGVTGATPPPPAAGSSVLSGLLPPASAGQVPTAARPATASRPSPLWANPAILEAAGAAEGISAELTPAPPRPVHGAVAAQGPGERSLSDQRFAELFAPPSAPAPAVRVNPLTSPQPAVNPAAGFEPLLPRAPEPAAPLPPLEGTTTPVAPLGQPAAPQAPAAAPAPLLTLPSGLQVAEQEVLQQVFGQLAPRNLSGPQRLTLRLNPEELGEVRLELIVDKETVRAHLQAQSQQVQEVLEKHLPRLREAFEQQGLKLQELQVSVDAGRDGGRSFFSQSQQQQTPNFAASAVPRRNLDTVAEPLVTPPAAPARSAGGLSLRV
jgi:hypothetical protein